MTARLRYQQTGAPLPETHPIWMRLAAHRAPASASASSTGQALTSDQADGASQILAGGNGPLSYSQWAAGFGAGDAAYALYTQVLSL